ncbi:MAG: amidohydrolase [Cyanobacteria bacterium]|nr:amidohydrolase [Cyanobacteria bacterium CG_2015-16_32_12]NCO76823.1 amidohydrolase [Cyanobacteria bacterium CG_2015-22_32_23]NCQ05052.1 amidohydrolase [Cyanobacteria bacterium CG_2015-09_32_10]NCQ42616.1 amidohydrolase [Cyanobacteria bacterium CG_2015-04_32_10]NCS85492.1 amidohydrolase [Cyanobacteria bacterium CG_2015-02_32_10]
MLSKIKDLAVDLTPRLIEIRRHFHAHPELSAQEYQTATYVAGVLSSCGLHVTEGIGKTGVIGELKGNGKSTLHLAIRTDMDALPIQEATQLEYASRVSGVMHACGHDLHTTVGLGTAMILSQLKDSLLGDIRFIFQPAEEIAQGALWMVEDGVMKDISAIFGVHVFPSIPARCVGIRYGALTSAMDDLEIIIQGEAGHGARPHQAIDAIWISAQVITSLQQAISRMQNPLDPLVLTIGQINGGKAPNIIADQVKMIGTVRSLNPEVREKLPTWIKGIVEGICHTYGAKCQINYRHRLPSVQNDVELTKIIEKAALEALGEKQVISILEPSLGAEDFAVYLEHAHGTMFRLGVGKENHHNYPLHHPRFELDESSLTTGVVTMAYSAYKYFCHKSN